MKLPARTLLLLALPLLHACGGSLENEGHVRLVNATSNYSKLDLYQSTTELIAGVAAGSSSDYAGVAQGSYTFDLANGGSSSTAASVSATLDNDGHLALLAYVTGGSLHVIALSEDESAPSSGMGKLRVLNAASSEVASVDVYLVNKACNTIDGTDVPAFQGVAGVTNTGFSQITAGSYRVCVTAADEPTDLRYEIPALALANQQVATLVLTRSSGGTLLDGMLMNQQGTVTGYDNPYARVRLVADAAAGATVSAAVNGTALASGYASPTVGAYKLVDAGELSTTLGIGGTAVASSGLTAASGADLTLLVAGSAASPVVSLLNDVNLPSSSSTRPARIRLVNGLNAATGTLMLTVDGDVVADSVAFGSTSTAVNVASSSATATLEISQGGTVLKSLADQTLAGSRVYSLFVLGDAGGTVTTVLRADR